MAAGPGRVGNDAGHACLRLPCEEGGLQAPSYHRVSFMSLSIYLMSRFNPYTDFETILWSRLLSGAAVAFHFVPLTALTMRAFS